MTSAPLDEWLRRLESIHPREIDLGLQRITAVARKMALLQPSASVITVAGTNGKGSTVAVLEALLLECGLNVGAYTSPHFLRFNERVRVAGKEAADEEIVGAFERIEEARGDISLTYFEFATLAALDVFSARCCDVLLLEVGLGGRLDAVNILDADLAVITAIDLDHQDWLGDDRAGISLEKAAVARRGRPVVIADRDPPAEMLAFLEAEGASPVLLFGRDFGWGDVHEAEWQGFIRAPNGEQRLLPSVPAGGLLPDNVLSAAQGAALLGLSFSDEAYRHAALSELTGRRQWRKYDERNCLVDVAHNPASINKLVEYLSITHCNGRRIAVFSAMSDKDIEGMLAATEGQFDAWFLGDLPDNPRSARASELAEILRSRGEAQISVNRDLPQALSKARIDMAQDDQLVVFGSFFTVAAVLPLLEAGGQA